MNDTAVATTDLDRLAERVERAAALVISLRQKSTQLEQERNALREQSENLEQERQLALEHVAKLEAERTTLLSKAVSADEAQEAVALKLAEAEKANAALLTQQQEADTRIAYLLETQTKSEQTLATLQTQAATLEQERVALGQRLEETKSQLQGQDPVAVVTELAALKKEQREWVNERRDVAARIEAICAKLDRLD